MLRTDSIIPTTAIKTNIVRNLSLSIAFLAGILSGALALADQAASREGAYTEAQAALGQRLYEKHCAACHGVKLEGTNGVALAGSVFLNRCADEGRSADDLFYIMRTFMPYGEPGKLSKQQYVDIIAYLLKINGHPAGSKNLSTDAKILGRILLATSK